MRPSGKLLPLAAFLCLSLACGQSGNSPRLNFADVLPEDWQHVHTYRLDTDHDGGKEWVVLYRFDLLAKTERRSGPIAAVVYQPDGGKPPCIIPYELRPRDGDYLCECDCIPDMKDVLSGPEDDELIVCDHCDGEITRASIFHWEPDKDPNGKYESLGHFSGSRIEVGSDTVTVEQRLPGRAQLAMRYTYLPRDNETYYQQGDQGTLVEYDKYELVFYQGEPEDVMRSPYPEKVVLAVYNHYEGEDASKYFTEEGWSSVEQCDAERCGCTLARSEIEHVRVIELQPGEEARSQEPCHQCEDHGPDKATVEVTVICEHKNDGEEDGRVILRWHLVREDDRWKLDSAEVVPPEGEGGGGQ